MMNGQTRRIGYFRVSLTDKTPETQVNALVEAGCTELYNGIKPLARPEGRQQLVELLRDGDELLVYGLDRLIRDEHTLATFQQQLQAAGVSLIVLADQPAAGGEHD